MKKILRWCSCGVKSIEDMNVDELCDQVHRLEVERDTKVDEIDKLEVEIEREIEEKMIHTHLHIYARTQIHL